MATRKKTTAKKKAYKKRPATRPAAKATVRRQTTRRRRTISQAKQKSNFLNLALEFGSGFIIAKLLTNVVKSKNPEIGRFTGIASGAVTYALTKKTGLSLGMTAATALELLKSEPQQPGIDESANFVDIKALPAVLNENGEQIELSQIYTNMYY